MYPFYHGRHLFNQMKANTIAICRGEELPNEPEEEKSYGHCIIFFETMTESLMQLCLNALILREFGLSPNGYERSNQISGLFSSLISIVLLFAKVRKHNQIVIVLIPLGNQLYAYLKNSYLFWQIGGHSSRFVLCSSI